MRQLGFFFCILLFFLIPHGQNAYRGPAYLAAYRSAEKLFTSDKADEKTDSLALLGYCRSIQLLGKGEAAPGILLDCYLKSGILRMSRSRNDSALADFKSGLSLQAIYPNLADSLFFKLFLYGGTIFYEQNELDSSLQYYKAAEKIGTKNPGLSEIERFYNKMGALYYETGDYKKSIRYFTQALSIVEGRKPFNPFIIVNYKNNIAAALLKMRQFDKALDIFKSLLTYHEQQDQLYYNMATCFLEQGKFAEAISQLSLIRQLDFEKANSLTKAYIYLGKLDSAHYFLDKAKKWAAGSQDLSLNIDRSITMINQGDYESAKGNFLQAVENYQSAISLLSPGYAGLAGSSPPTSFKGLLNFSQLFEALVAEAKAFDSLSARGSALEWMGKSFNAYKSALSLSRHIARTYYSDDAKMFLKSKVNPVVASAVDLALRLFHQTRDFKYVNEAFALSEDHKASILQAGLQQLELSEIAGLPKDLLAQEKNLKSILTRLTIQASFVKDSVSLKEIDTKIRTYSLALDAVQGKLQDDPHYSALGFSHPLITLDSLQAQTIGKEDVLLSYFYSARSLICFFVTREGPGVREVPLTKDFFAAISIFRADLENPGSQGMDKVAAASKTLYGKLLGGLRDNLKGKNHLIIIPYNEIAYIPFEALVNPQTNHLVVRQFSVSYQYAAPFLFSSRMKGTVPYQVLAMAPFAGLNDHPQGLPALPNSANEIEGLPGRIFKGGEATKARFIALSPHFPIIHLATHGFANDEDPLGTYVEFNGNWAGPDSLHRLYEPEIYNLDLRGARLIILSACETGKGRLVNGEGIMSMSRAFSYAGCQTVLTSLWRADDLSTAFIMRRFHEGLQQGLPVDKALQQAKLDYLNSDQVDPRYKSPAYWAHLVIIGEEASLARGRFPWIFFLLGLALLALGAHGWIRKIKKPGIR